MRKGVKKFVLITSIGTGDSKDAPPKQVYDVLKSVLVEKEKAENHLRVRMQLAHRWRSEKAWQHDCRAELVFCSFFSQLERKPVLRGLVLASAACFNHDQCAQHP